jgi:hypothetical protein
MRNAVHKGLWIALALTPLCACGPIRAKTAASPAALGGFPYHPLIYHLDLSILAYQLYSQSLVWPFDPYYEERAQTFGAGRALFIARVHDWAQRRGAEQLRSGAGLGSYRGPGVLGGFEDNPRHDPIIYDYAKLHPWSSSITNVGGQWTEYLTPSTITGRIRDVYVSYRRTGGAEGDVVIAKVPARREDWDRTAADSLLAFEGGTGDKGVAGQPASQSLMGFVLVRAIDGRSYDVHIAFRGSRSGSAARAVVGALSDAQAEGNPDWITDLGWNKLDASGGARDITTIGAVSRGFTRSMRSILPALVQCLRKAAELKGDVAPRSIYVTGHSLGGALAQHFVSAVLLGDLYGPDGAGPGMPEALRRWPWTQIKLITYSAPRAGDSEWAKALTTHGLDSEFFTSALNPMDTAALTPTDPGIVSRLLDTSRPAGFRVLMSTDPITTEKVGGGGKHVGKTVYVNTPRALAAIGPPNVGAHEPEAVRRFMVDAMADARTPAIAWRYRAMKELNPGRNGDRAGTRAEFEKLGDAVRGYYSERGLWFDDAAFARDLDLLYAIESGGAN